MKTTRLHVRLGLASPVETIWKFLADANNLVLLTPSKMRFQIVSPSEEALAVGQVFRYRLSPLPFFRTSWVSEITEVEPGVRFVDRQLEGPYAHWVHEHKISAISGGSLLEDIVEYAAPLGALGRLGDRWYIRGELRETFGYRSQGMRERFGELPEHPMALEFS